MATTLFTGIALLVTLSVATAAYFEADTCCVTMSACDGCAQVYHVNSVSYCCPNCTGNVLVTALVCHCKYTYSDPKQAPTCSVSNKIVGDYPYWKPSYYVSRSNPVAAVSIPLTTLLSASAYISRRLLYS